MGSGAVQAPDLRRARADGRQEAQRGNEDGQHEERQRDRVAGEDVRTAARDDQGPAQGGLEHRTQHEGEDEGRRVELELAREVADDAEDDGSVISGLDIRLRNSFCGSSSATSLACIQRNGGGNEAE